MNFEDRKMYRVKYFLTLKGDKEDICYLNMAVTAPDKNGDMKDIMVSVKAEEFAYVGYDDEEDDWDDKYEDQVKFETLSTLLCKEAMKNNIDPSILDFIDSLSLD